MVATCGCQEQPAAPGVTARGPVDTSTVSTGSSADDASRSTVPVAGETTDNQSAPEAIVAATSQSTADPSQAQAVAGQSAARPAEATVKWVKPRANPSAEQIKAWSVPADREFQMLACYDFDDHFVQDMAVTPDGQQFVLAGSQLTLWKVGQSQPLLDLVASYPNESDVERPLLSVEVSPDGEWLAAGDKRGRLRVWKLRDQTEAYVIPAHEGRLTEIAISPDSQTVATTSYSGEVRVWQLADGQKLKTFKVDQQEVAALAFLSETRLATAGREVSLWDLATGEKVATVSNERVARPILGLWPDRQGLVYADQEGRAMVWDVASGKTIGPALSGTGAGLVDYSTDGQRIASYAADSTVRLWNAATRATTQVIDADGERTVALRWLPQSGALIVASERGRVRLWGTAAMASTLGITPPASPQLRESGTPTKRSDTPARFQQVIDVRSFPRLPQATAGFSYGGMESYVARVSQNDAELFYRHSLGEAGWLEAATVDPAAPGLNFQKDGCGLNVSFSSPVSSTGGREQDLQINLRFAGNYDARWLPRVAPVDGPGAFASMSFVSYRSRSDLTELEAALLRQLHDAGWIPFSRLASSHAEVPESRMLTFIQRGSVLTVSLGYPADSKSEIAVQAIVDVSRKALPLPPDASWIEFDSSTDLRLVANTRRTLQETIQFFDTEMALDGWLAREAGRYVDEKENRAFLPYIRGQQDVLVRLAQLPDGRTRILAGDAEQTSWQVANEVAATAPKAQVAVAGIEAADLELPAGASAVKFNVDEKQIEFLLAELSPQKYGEQFVQQLEALDWSRDGAGVVSDEYVFITLKGGKAEIELRARQRGDSTHVMIGGDGLLWSKPLPAAPVRVSYETWLRRGNKPATLELLDQFLDEMRQLPAVN